MNVCELLALPLVAIILVPELIDIALPDAAVDWRMIWLPVPVSEAYTTSSVPFAAMLNVAAVSASFSSP